MSSLSLLCWFPLKIQDLRHWSEYRGSTYQGDGCRTKQVTFYSASFCCCKRCCWDVCWFRNRYQQGDLSLTIIPICCLTKSSWILSHTSYFLVSRSYTKLAHFVFSASIKLLIVFTAFEDSKRNSWGNEKPCKQHPRARLPARQAQGSSNLTSTA